MCFDLFVLGMWWVGIGGDVGIVFVGCVCVCVCLWCVRCGECVCGQCRIVCSCSLIKRLEGDAEWPFNEDVMTVDFLNS